MCCHHLCNVYYLCTLNVGTYMYTINSEHKDIAVSDRYSFGIGIGRYVGIGRYIGLADMGKAYRYRLSVSADKKVYIGRLPI